MRWWWNTTMNTLNLDNGRYTGTLVCVETVHQINISFSYSTGHTQQNWLKFIRVCNWFDHRRNPVSLSSPVVCYCHQNSWPFWVTATFPLPAVVITCEPKQTFPIWLVKCIHLFFLLLHNLLLILTEVVRQAFQQPIALIFIDILEDTFYVGVTESTVCSQCSPQSTVKNSREGREADSSSCRRETRSQVSFRGWNATAD